MRRERARAGPGSEPGRERETQTGAGEKRGKTGKNGEKLGSRASVGGRRRIAESPAPVGADSREPRLPRRSPSPALVFQAGGGGSPEREDPCVLDSARDPERLTAKISPCE